MGNRKNASLTLGSEALQGLFENGKSPLSQQFLRWKIWRKWAEFVGASIGEHSEPVGYVRGTLYVWVKNSTWMQQMVFMKNPIRDQINKKLGFNFVKNIHFTLDKMSVPKDAQEAKDLKESIAKLMINDNLDEA